MSRHPTRGIDDLQTTHLDLVAEWHPTLNGDLLPSDFLAGSGKKVFWKCKKCNYEWAAVISNRAKLGRGCPCCSNHIVAKGKNDLSTTHPEIAKEWYQPKNGTLTPSDVTYGSGKKVSWLCPMGHVYVASILHRTTGGTKCPICNSGRQTSFAEQAVFYYVKKIYPNAISHYTDIFTRGMELDIYIPEIKLGIEYDGVYWHNRKTNSEKREAKKYNICRKNGIKLLRIREKKTKEGEFPPADENLYLPTNETDTNALNYVIQLLLSDLDPESNMWTRTNQLQIWSRVNVDVDRDRFEILSYLEGPVKNSVSEVAPELAAEWDYERNGEIKPNMIQAGSSQKINWICPKCNYRWAASVYHRITDHTGCPKCAGLVLEKGVNDLATKAPELLEEWDYELNKAERLEPNEIQYNSGKKAHWICQKCGKKWTTSIRARSIDGHGCIQCGYNIGRELRYKNKLAVQGGITNPLLLKEWDYEKNEILGLFPERVLPGSTKNANWICSTCGNRWKAPIARRSGGAGCRKCADKANGELRIKTLIESGHGITSAILINEWDYEKNTKLPTDYSYGSNEKVYWKCSICGHSWKAVISSRQNGAGCPSCAGNICIPGKNDLQTERPDIAAEWDYEKNKGITPKEIACNSNKKYWWICPKGHNSYYATLNHRVSGTGCPICGNDKIADKLSKSVDQLSLGGAYIKTFSGLKYAAEECGVSRSAICNAIKKGTVSAGYRWRFHCPSFREK